MPDKSAKYLDALYKGAKPSAYKYAKDLRTTSTQAEQKLWSFLRNRQLKGKKFRRQHAIAGFVLDFYCNECKLAIELDGNFHNNKEAKDYDKARTAALNEFSITVIKFWNDDVMKNIEIVLKRIEEHLY